eukprot:3871963-Alexandrium_andersonii.AAC.1
MSASLVGSEMCIRDSIRRCTRGVARRPADRRRWRRLRCTTKEGTDAGGPVSYTHLTLPTICSV